MRRSGLAPLFIIVLQHGTAMRAEPALPSAHADQAGLEFCNAIGDRAMLVTISYSRACAEQCAQWKSCLGRDEIGELRNSLDTLKVETEKQAVVHQELAGKMRQELELPVGSFITRQVSHKKTIQATVEKGLKNKQAQEGHVQKARERYESDCLKINSAMAQQTLVQGKELERVRMKLERAQATIGSNEKEYHSFTRALADTTKKWEQQWKDFCDTCQDLEDDRIEFMKDNVWSYANAVSSVCVSDDESCEHIRVSLEQLEVDRDMENFISAYGTGSIIPDPPRFVDFRAGAPGDTQQGRRGRLAQFVRESKKVGGPLYGTTPVEDYELDNGAQSGGSRAATPLDAHPALPPQPLPPPFSQPPPQQGSYQGHPGRSGALEPVMLNVGGTAYPVDPNADPQRYQHRRQPSISNSVGTVSSTAIATPGASDDPLAQAMNQLRQDSCDFTALSDVRLFQRNRRRQRAPEQSATASSDRTMVLVDVCPEAGALGLERLVLEQVAGLAHAQHIAVEVEHLVKLAEEHRERLDVNVLPHAGDLSLRLQLGEAVGTAWSSPGKEKSSIGNGER
ncbi:hypothetical protein CALVIDRAFT_530249 [Calocera viscosa TUFC12733]|uniref:F-BAR domain-containing protein n=1 Tax=Calocera viscosa (strain TUFC12733) TaxID=1330018 RepID=A0A167I3U5_CALVF|nr:hypothetical protein CALVIDRAFT_530249 [Calocera viscosa TUFC12733]